MIKNKKEYSCGKMYEYKSIPGIPDDYLDYLLVASIHKDILYNIMFKECESQLMKGLMYKYKINKKSNPTNEQLIEIALEFMSKDKKRELYNRLNSFNNKLLNDFLAVKGLDGAFESEENLIEDIQNVIEVVDFPHLLCHIRTERHELFDIAPMLLALWRNSDRYYMDEYEEDFDFDVETWLRKAIDNEVNVDFDKIINKINEEKIIDLDDDEFLEAVKNSSVDETVKMIKEYLDILVRKSNLHKENYEKSLEIEDELKESEKLVTKLKKKVKSLESKLEKLTNDNDELLLSLEQANKKKESLEASLNDKASKIEELKKEKKENNKKTRELNNKVNELVSKIDEYKSKEKETESNALIKEEAMKLVVDENENLKSRCEKLTGELRTLKYQQEKINKEYEDEIKLLKSKSTNINVEYEKEVAIDNEINEVEEIDYNYGDLFGDDLTNNPTY